MEFLRRLEKLLLDITEVIAGEAPKEPLSPFEERVEARYEAFIDKAEQMIVALMRPAPVLCGVTIHPEYEEQSEGRSFRMGGKAAILGATETRRFTFSVDAPVSRFTLKSWGGCVITDVMIGNHTELIGHHDQSISEGTFGKVSVGTLISVQVKLPVE